MRLKFILLLSSLILFLANSNFAQITSSGLSGVLLDEQGKPMQGAIVEAVHTPSGTKYGTDTKGDGSFTIVGMRVGGPYTVTVSFGGAVIRTFENISLELGQTYGLNVRLSGDATHQLSGVTVTTSRDNAFNSQRTGATTIIDAGQIANFPTVGRNALDLTALSPLSNGSNSFAGRNNLYNNVQINGANFNNAFGVSGDNFSGGGMPIPLDAVQQLQVAVSDFDVRQADFTGANINLVTKSGTNDFTGSAYTYYRNQSFAGDHVGSTDLPPATKLTDNIYGVTLGGPIIKNKLFFFVAGEYERSVSPALSPYWVANSNGLTGPTISRANADSLQEVSNYAKSAYGYNTGAYPGGPGYNNSFIDEYTRFTSRLDYNLNDKNKIDVTYSYYYSTAPSLPNSTSAAVGNVTNARNGQNALSFANTDYSTVSKVNSFAAEWVTNITSSMSNQLLATYTQNRSTRSSPSSQFPFVDIFDASSGTNYTSLGYELFTYKNDIQQNTASIYDNFTIHAGINNITAGASYQYLTFANSYLPYGTMYYRYNSIQDFVTGQSPAAFGYTYPYAGQDGYSRVNYGLPGVYVQDKISLFGDKLFLTGGIRADMPLYLNNIPNNPYIDTLNLANPNSSYNNGFGQAFNTTHYNASKWPNEKPVIQPRIGFNWSPMDNHKLQIHGGTGFFLGQVPFVWFTNAPANTGVVSNNVQIANPPFKFATTPAALFSELTPAQISTYFPQQAGNSVPGLIAAVAPNFKMPEVWRSELTADYKLPWLGLIATADAMFTKDLYSVFYFNANLPNPVATLQDSNDHRAYYSSARIYNNVSGAYILTNSTLGFEYSGTIGVARPAQKGFYGSIYYTHMLSEEVSPNPGSQASSAWEDYDYVNTPNEQKLGRSNYYTPNRVVANLSYRIEYAKHFASTVSLYYSGYNPGNFDFTYGYDENGLGTAGNIFGQLVYIPHNADELNWIPIKNGNTTVFSVAQEEAAFNAFMSQDKYLNNHRGQVMERNGESYPFRNLVNLKFAEDIYSNVGKRKNTLQLTCDVLNFANLLDKNWGLAKILTVPYGSILNMRVDQTIHNGPNGPYYTYSNVYTMATMVNSQGQTVLPTSTFMNSVSTSSVWSMNIGLRYIF